MSPIKENMIIYLPAKQAPKFLNQLIAVNYMVTLSIR